MDAKARPEQNSRSVSWLNGSVLGIGLTSLLADAGHEMATAALPALLASFGAGSAALGLIEGASDALAGFAKLFSGFYSDGLRRRKPLA
ncbi:MAG: MFS transporter, partial [Elusimicrobia bacterium]|nr:MFS transporter [Elusimicrobiota bacterium]